MMNNIKTFVYLLILWYFKWRIIYSDEYHSAFVKLKHANRHKSDELYYVGTLVDKKTLGYKTIRAASFFKCDQKNM